MNSIGECEFNRCKFNRGVGRFPFFVPIVVYTTVVDTTIVGTI